MAIFIDLKVATNGNYVLHDRSCQKWQLLLTSLATICLITQVAKNANFYWPQSCQKRQLLAL